MRKLITLLIILAATIFSAYGIANGLKAGEPEPEFDYDYDYDMFDRDPDVDYYGCPNSKRVRKLNIKKNAKKA